MNTKSAFEMVAELHKSLVSGINPANRIQIISDHGFGAGASNEPQHQLEFLTYISKETIFREDTRYSGFCQGFYAVSISLRVVWGGCHHDGTAITTPEIKFCINNRLGGGMSTQNWTDSGICGDALAFEKIRDTVNSLLQRP